MDRPAGRPAADEHWAPDHLVLERRVLSHAGRLFVEQDADGTVLTHSPLAGMAAVEQRYPAWALGPFGRIEPENDLPSAPGVYALVTQGTVRYVGGSSDLARTFGQRSGLGDISRRDAQNPRREEHCRLNRLVTAEARAGITVDLYVLASEPPRGLARLVRRPGDDVHAIAAELAATSKGSWHLPR